MTFLRLLRAGFHSTLLFVLPWVLGLAAGAVFDIGEVTETGASFFFYFMLIALPLLFLQLVSIVVRVRRETRAQATFGRRGFSVFVEAVDKHARLLTGRGLGMVMGASIALLCALGLKWGQFAVMAVAGLGLLYMCVTAATVASAFSILSFHERPERTKRAQGNIERRMVPPLVTVGDPAQEEFTLSRVPIPPLYRLHISESLPDRLGGETRFALDRNASRESVTVRAPLMQTLRGVYEFGPAEIAYEDIFGLTRVTVASLARVGLRVLPRLSPVVFSKNPKDSSQGEGPFSKHVRFPTDDYYRIREYLRGDDVRRIHWKRSIQIGALQLRMPETVPYRPQEITLALDTYLPPQLDASSDHVQDALDMLVEGWLSLARALVERGEKVTLLVAAWNGTTYEVKALPAKRSEISRWRSLGAEVRWQSQISPTQLALVHSGQTAPNATPSRTKAASSMLWASAGLTPVPPPEGPDGCVVWVDACAFSINQPKDRGLFRRLIAYPFPTGSDENRLKLRSLFSSKKPEAWTLQEIRRHVDFGLGAMRGQGIRIYPLRRRGAALVLGGA